MSETLTPPPTELQAGIEPGILNEKLDEFGSPLQTGREWLPGTEEDEPDALNIDLALITSPVLMEAGRGFMHMQTENGNLIVQGSDGDHVLEWYPNDTEAGQGPSQTIKLETLLRNHDATPDIQMGEQWAGFSQFGRVTRAGEYYYRDLHSNVGESAGIESETNEINPHHEIQEVEPTAETLTRNDQALVEYLLGMGQEEYDSMYGLLTGMKSIESRRPWDTAKKAEAQTGMRELMETALGVQFTEDGIDGARTGLARLRTDEELNGTRQKLAQRGRRLKYQNMPERRFHDGFRMEGDFLHFGIDNKSPDAPDALEHATRIYVTPKMEATGHVAAEVIKRAREKGYEPYGKVWDDSSREGNVNDRLDRILFWPRTESQVNIIMGALEEIQREQPELFEDNGPLGTSETALKGVGLAEEPVQSENELTKQSFNQVREDLIYGAWEQTAKSILSVDSIDNIDVASSQLRQAVERGDIALDQVIDSFRMGLQEAAPKYHVDPNNLAFNARSSEGRQNATNEKSNQQAEQNQHQAILGALKDTLEADGRDIDEANTQFEAQVQQFVRNLRNTAAQQGRNLNPDEMAQVRNLSEMVKQQRRIAEDLNARQNQ